MTGKYTTLPDAITALDMFCGAGGSSEGATWAGAEIIYGLNHWDEAIKTHAARFPKARHDHVDIPQTDPRRYPRPHILIASPECTWQGNARGEKNLYQPTLFGEVPDPAAVRSRATMYDPLRFAEAHLPLFAIIENVVD